MTFFKKLPACKNYHLQCRSQRSYKPPWPRPVLLIALVLIVQAAYGATGCMLGRCVSVV